MKHDFLITICLLSLLSMSWVTSHKTSLEISNDFIDSFEQLKNYDKFDLEALQNAIYYIDAKTTDQKQESKYHQHMGDILNEYAKQLFYGNLNNGEPQLQKAFFFFKLASAYGNAESQYYLSFYSFYNLDGRFLFKHGFENLPETDRNETIKEYIKNMNTTALVKSAQLSSFQGYSASQYLLGNLYLKGRGTEPNYAMAALYFKSLADKLFTDDYLFELNLQELYEKRRLDSLYFNEELDVPSLPLKDNPQEYQYLVMSTVLGQIPQIMDLANTYYFGLRGEKRDFQKAFEYFGKAASLGNNGAKAKVGYMLIKGIGTNKDVKRGIEYLEDAAKYEDPVAKTLLGELYKKGEGVARNETVALEYFKEAAKTNYSAALYNYGSALMSTNNKEDSGTAMEMITLAARQGHPLALSRIAMEYLHNGFSMQHYAMGASILKAALERGPWSDKLKEGYYSFMKKLYKQAALYYMESALLGNDFGAVNAALIIDEFKVFNEVDLDVSGLQKEIFGDPVWLVLNSTYQYRPPKDIYSFLFEDLLTIISKSKGLQEKKTTIMNVLTQISPEFGIQYRQNLALKLLKLAAEDNEPLSLMVLGDVYQAGKYGEKDYNKAYRQYSQIVSEVTPYVTPSILSHTFYNLGYMNHNGMGMKKNLTQAIEYYNMSSQFGKKGSYLTLMSEKLAKWEKEYVNGSEESTENQDKSYLDGIKIIKEAVDQFEQLYAKKLIIGVLVLAAVVLYLARMRLENYLNMNYQKNKTE